MRTVGCFLFLLVLAGCSGPAPESNDGEEAPFFQANRFGSGPLTLDELQIDIPDEIDAELSDAQRVCFMNAVARRAEEAGDPALIDPDELVYWGGNVSKEEWQQHDRYMQRVLLAQGIVSWAMIDCT